MMFITDTFLPIMNESNQAYPEKHYHSSQYKNNQFSNNWRDSGSFNITEMAEIAWNYVFYKNKSVPGTALPNKNVDFTPYYRPLKNRLYATWLGHSSVLITIDDHLILTDPVFEKHVSYFGPTRYSGDIPMDIDQVPMIDAVVISHDHYDHLNKYTIQQLEGKTKKFFVPLAVGSHLIAWGVPQEKIIELDWWESKPFDARLTITATPAQHFSGRSLIDQNQSLWTSWVISGTNHNIFFSGDSGYFDGFKKIGKTYGPFDMTFVECGSYDKNWHRVHMFPEEAVQAHIDLQGQVLHPIHWGTFKLAFHPWYEPMERLLKAAEKAGVNALTPVIGETSFYGESSVISKWWNEFDVA
jgi:L-ascorbate metabolism protein UlaG (beta-lactamase superfamily)